MLTEIGPVFAARETLKCPPHFILSLVCTTIVIAVFASCSPKPAPRSQRCRPAAVASQSQLPSLKLCTLAMINSYS